MTILPAISEIEQVPNSTVLALSTGARRCLRLLASFAARSGKAFPFQRTLAEKLDCNIRTVSRYVRELRDAGVVQVQKRQQSSALYKLSSNCGNPVENGTHRTARARENVVSGVVSETPPKSVGNLSPVERRETGERRNMPSFPLERKISEYFGKAEIGGKTADQPLIRRIARILQTEAVFERWKEIFRAWSRRSSPERWGLFVILAEDARRTVYA